MVSAADYFVAIIALAVAVLLLVAVISNRDRFYHFNKVQWFEKKWGRTAIRLIYLVAALTMLAMGTILLLGWAPAQQERQQQTNRFARQTWQVG